MEWMRALGVLVDGDDFYVDTDLNAPNHEIVKAEMGKAPQDWKVIVPEAKDVLEGANIVGGKMFIKRLHDVKSEETIYTLEGKEVGRISLPGIGDESGAVRPAVGSGRLLHFSIDHPASDNIPLRREDREERSVQPVERCRLTLRSTS